jgi:hypothetical protein
LACKLWEQNAWQRVEGREAEQSLTSEKLAMLESRLQDFNRDVRLQALNEVSRLMQAGQMDLAAESDVVNMHCHTFFSYNAYGYSPSSLAWLAKQRGFRAIGIVDFDVLDGVDEFLSACDTLGVRGSAGLETRVILPEFSTREMNSPGEPGVYYAMGIGFTASTPSAAAVEQLADMRFQSEQRNRKMLERLNAHMRPVTIDYARDVQTLTPAGTATERHILQAYLRAVQNQCADAVAFWAEKLNLAQEKVADAIVNEAAFQNLVRAKLMKKGGVGYVQPGPESFPSMDVVHRVIESCGALPCATWLDGTTNGEQAIEELLDVLIANGAVALNIIPDRNWNIAEEHIRKEKIKNLYAVAKLAQTLALPLQAGTEMNSHGQKLVDDFHARELFPLRGAFLAGAFFIYGHTRMQRALRLGYQSKWAKAHLPRRKDRNAFYEQIGRGIPPGRESERIWERLSDALSPAEILGRLRHPA